VSQENVERFSEFTETFNRFAETGPSALGREDVNRWLEFFDPDVRFEPIQSALQGSYTGHDGVRRWLADGAEVYGPVQLRFVDIRDLGDRVLALGSLRLTGQGSGIRTEVPVAIVATLQDGLITHVTDYGVERDQALKAVGLEK
jgi:ketosteroid isomerase-like protein